MNSNEIHVGREIELIFLHPHLFNSIISVIEECMYVIKITGSTKLTILYTYADCFYIFGETIK